MKKVFIPIWILMMCLCLPMRATADFSLRGYEREAGYQYVALGSFPQQADGTQEPILWRVLSVEEGEAYLLSEYILFNNRVHPDDRAYIEFGGAFNQTEMFALLNGPFEGEPVSLEEQEKLKSKWRIGRVHIAEICFKDEAFTADEQAMLVSDEELGMVFLPTADDLKNADYGFTTSKSRKAFGTPYAIEHGLFKYGNGSSPYWTRTQSISYSYATRCTKVDGDIGYIRCVVMNEGCRPAVRLKLGEAVPTGGTGTMDDPFTFVR